MKTKGKNCHHIIVIREEANKRLERDVDRDWPIDMLNYAKGWHKPKYHGTKYRGMKRWK